jgi:GcrA cell cycle regulator
MPHETRWNPENTARLIEIIAEGVRPREAGLRLGISRCAVIGKCHREGIPLAHARKQFQPAPSTPNPFPPHNGCLWPYSDPDNPLFHFCGGDQLPGKPYCAAHAAIAYTEIPDRVA